MDLPITILEAVAGGKVPVPLLDGEVRLNIPPGAQSGQKLRLRGKGVEMEGQRGDLYVVLRPTPPAAGAEVERLARELEAHYATDPRALLREQLQRPVTTGG
jgi:DnaJ-class molecular chaperone